MSVQTEQGMGVGAFAVDVIGVGAWLDGYPSAKRLFEQRPLEADESPKPTGLAYNRVNRRRASQMGRALADAVAEAMEQAAVDPREVPVIVGSSIGEASAMIGLLDQMWREREPMSPAVFTVSVHNAASGLLSISAKNKGYTTSIAADYDTPAAALFEAIGLIATGQHDAVCCVCADEASPRALLEHLAPEDRRDWDMLASAIVLRRRGASSVRVAAPPAAATATATDPDEVVEVRPPAPALASLTIAAKATSSASEQLLAPARLEERFVHSPQAGLLDLIDAVMHEARGSLRLDRGRGRGYIATLVDPLPHDGSSDDGSSGDGSSGDGSSGYDSSGHWA